MGILPENDKQELRKIFESSLKDEVKIILFLDKEKNPEPSKIAEELARDLENTSDKVKFEIIDSRSENGQKLLREYNLALDQWGNKYGPIFVFEKKPNIVYYGLPAGEEFAPFLEDIISISRNNVEISLQAAKKIAKVNKEIDIWIFVTPPCPYCPIMTSAAHKFAFLNNKIRGVMIMATDFPEFSDAYNVYAVPKNVIRHKNKDLLIWEGAMPDNIFAEQVLKAIEKIK